MGHDTADRGCAEYRSRLADLSTGALPEAEASEVAGHVDSCAACTAELDSLVAVGRLLDRVRPEAPPAQLWDDIEPRLRPRRRWLFRVLAPAAVLASASIVLVVLLVRPGMLPTELHSTARYDVVGLSDMDDDADTVVMYAHSSARSAWLDPAAEAVYLGAVEGGRRL